MDLRVRVMADVDGGMKATEAARRYRVSTDWIRKLKRLRRETGSIAPRQQRVNHSTKLDNDLPKLEQLVKERPDATLKEPRAALGCEASTSCIWRALHRLKITFKKVLIAAEQKRPDVEARRGEWKAEQADLPVERLVLIDEMGLTTNMVRRYGRARQASG
jgi:transposase